MLGASRVDYRKLLIAGALGALAWPASAAPVSASDNASGRVLILRPLELTKLDDLDFGTVIPSAVSGTVSINAKTGARSVTGGVTGLPAEFGKRAHFAGAGSAGQQVFIGFDPPTELVSTTNSADKVPVLALTLDGSPFRIIDPVTRTFFFGIGGVLQIDANQAEGFYEATFDVTAVYL